MTPWGSARAVVAAGALLALLAGGAAGAAPPRVVAVGDVHGALDAFLDILRRAELVDANGDWTGGDAVLVQTGDLLDRGERVREVLDLLIDLESQAAAAGGRVVVLLGNHEAMNLMATVRDVNPLAYARFADDGSRARQKAAWKEWQALQRRLAEARGLPPPVYGRQHAKRFRELYPLGFVEYMEALGPDGSYGRWLRERPAAVTIGDVLFVHGGVAPERAAAGLEGLNRAVAAAVERFDRLRAELAARDLILPFSDLNGIVEAAALAARLAGVEVPGAPAADDSTAGETNGAGSELAVARAMAPVADLAPDLARDLAGLAALEVGDLNDENGPLWFRGLALWPEAEGAALLPPVLKALGVARMVAAHTPQADGRVQQRFGGRAYLIDTVMWAPEYPSGRASALELTQGRVTAVYPDGRQVLWTAGALKGGPAAGRAREGDREATGQ